MTDPERIRNYTKTDGGSFVSEKPLILFATELNGIIKGRWRSGDVSRVYRFTLYEQDNKIRDYIPCYRKSDNEVGFYDLINKTFLTHSGEGIFTAGPDITIGSIIYTDWTDEAGTIYGGYVDLVKGELVETHKKIIFDGSQELWTINGYPLTNTATVTYRYAIMNNRVGSDTYVYSYCDKMPCYHYSNSFLNSTDIPSYAYINNVASIMMRLPKSIMESTNTVNAYLEENPITIIYPMATPIVHQLTPTQLKTLRGTNNIWSNANGNIDLSYWKH